MGTRRPTRGRARPARRLIGLRGVALAAVLAAGGVGAWWWARVPDMGGAPRLRVDRTEVDLGYRRFDVPVRVVFTLSNAGEGWLRLAGTPQVRLVAGC